MLCLALAVYHEARGEPEVGQEAVAEVVINRSQNRDQSICQVVYSPHQFSWSRSKGIPEENESWVDSLSLAKKYVNGKQTNHTNGAEYFHTKDIPTNCKARNVKQIGNHVFYNLKKVNDGS